MMKNWKRVLLLLAIACAAALPSEAANLVSYAATDGPAAALDANGTVDAWTVTGDGGPDRSYLKGVQDGNTAMWAIWDLDGGGGTQATHIFAGGALNVGQTVSIDYTHHTNIDNGDSIGIRFLDGSHSEVEFVFMGGNLLYSRFDTGSGSYALTQKQYDNYDIFQVTFILTGPDSYRMRVTEGSIPDAGYKPSEDGNPDVGGVVDEWSGTFTGSSITGIQVYTTGGNESDQWFDNLVIHDGWLSAPHEPYPAHEQADVIVAGLELSWTVPQVRSQANPNVFTVDPNLVSFNLYYSDDNDPNFDAMTPISVTGWDAQTMAASYVPVPELNKNSTYTWRVDSVFDDGSILPGEVWTFDTELTKPIILTNPTHQIVDAGTTAVFSVVISTETPAVYQWYQYVDGISDVALFDGGDISGALTDTLSIANAEVADEGEYYCVVNNDAGIPVKSGRAKLAIKRMVAYWPFEGGLADSTVAGSPVSVLVGEPNFVTGIVGDGMEFEDGVDKLYTDPAQASYFDICNYQMTVACWVKTTDKQDWCALVARNGEGEGWQLRQSGFTDDRPCFTTRGTGSEDGTPANRTIYDGQWHYVVGTFDGTVKRVYIDGVVSRSYSGDDGSLVRDGDAVTSPIRATPSPVAIAGRVSGGGENPLNVDTGNIVAGVYDEVTLYNYALDAETIARTYADVVGTEICVSPLAYDLNDDCTVDMTDLGLLAAEWLSSAIVEPAL